MGKLELQVLSGHKVKLGWPVLEVNKAFLEFLARKARAVHKEKKVKVVVTAKTDCCQS